MPPHSCLSGFPVNGTPSATSSLCFCAMSLTVNALENVNGMGVLLQQRFRLIKEDIKITPDTMREVWCESPCCTGLHPFLVVARGENTEQVHCWG